MNTIKTKDSGITEIRLHSLLSALRKLNNLIDCDLKPQDVIGSICRILVDTKIYKRAWLILVDENDNYLASAEHGFSDKIVKEKLQNTKIPLCCNKKKNITLINKKAKLCNRCPLQNYNIDDKLINSKIFYNNKITGYLTVSIKTKNIDESLEKEIFKDILNDIGFTLNQTKIHNQRKSLLEKLSKNTEEIAAMNEELKFQNEELNMAIAKAHEGEEKFRIVTETTPTAVMIYQNDFWVYANSETLKICGYTEQELQKMKFWEIAHPDFRDKVKEQGKLRQGGTNDIFRYEFKILHKNGTAKWVYLSGNTTKYNGQTAGIISIIDIHQLKLAEKKLKESLERESILANFVRNASIGIAIGYPDGRIGMCNPAYERIIGYSADEIDKLNWNKDLTPTKWEEIEINKLKQLNKTTKPVTYEKEYIRKDGSIIPIELVVHPKINNKGEIESYFSFVSDISERKDIENKLFYSNQRFEKLASLTFEGICFHKNGEIIDVNSSFISMFSYSRNELINKNIIDLMVNKEYHNMVYDSLKSDSSSPFSIVMHRKDGEEIVVEVQGRNITENDNTFRVTSFRDLTERIKSEHAIIESERKLNQIVYGVGIATIVIDKEHNVTHWNKACENLVGIKAADVIGTNKQWMAFYDEERPILADIIIHENAEQEIEKYYKGKYIHSTILENCFEAYDYFNKIGKNGYWLHFTASPIFNTQGEIIGAIETLRDITQEKLAKEKLINSERLLNDVGKIAKIGGWEMDMTNNGKATWTKATYDIVGFNYGDYAPGFYDHVDWYLPEYREMIRKKMDDLLNHNIPLEYVARLKTKQGKIKWGKAFGKADFKNGKCVKLIGTFQDITEQKKAETSLKSSENKLRNFIDQSLDAIVITDAFGNILNWNKSQENITGYSFNDVCKYKIWKIQDKLAFEFNKGNNEKKYIDYIRSITDDTLKRSSLKPVNIAIKSKSGHKIILQQITFPIETHDGLLVGYISRDVTEIKEYQKQILEINKQLSLARDTAEKHREYLRMSLKTNSATVFHNNLITREVSCTPELFIHFGYSEEETPNTMEQIIEMIHPDDVNSVFVALNDHINGISEEYYAEYRIKNKKGDYVWIDGRGKVVEYYEDGKPKMLMGISRDINNIKLAKKELIAAKEKAEESDRLKSAFLANMSHEIRTPMNGILGFTNLLRNKNLNNIEQQKYIDIIQKSGERMLSTVNDIIEVSKIETGQINPEFSKININEQLEYYYHFFAPEAKSKGIELHYLPGLPNNEASIITDHSMFNSVITNLIKNAIKYTHKGEISFGYEMSNNDVKFFVKDTGIGIEKDRIEAIFDRFIQADIEDRSAYEGSGLGLSIAKAYIEMLGGKIWATSNNKGDTSGSTFFFTLPHKFHKNKNAFYNKPKSNRENSVNKKLKILVAEDDNDAIAHLTIVLEDTVDELLFAHNGKDAVEIAKKHMDIDMILMDIKMPILNGYEATRQIREFNKDVTIIAQTAYALSGDREKAIDVGCNEYITKPIDADKLIETISKLTGKVTDY